jgi:hypothetical protein
MTVSDYKQTYGVDKVQEITDEQKNNLSQLWTERHKDVYWQEKMNAKPKSIWSVDYWMSKGYTEDDAKLIIFEYQSKNSKKRDYEKSPSTLAITFWTQKGYSIEEATKKISEIQSKLSKGSKKFSGKKHSDITKETISNTMKSHINLVGRDRWVEHFGSFQNPIYRSEGEIELFNYIINFDSRATANEFICGYNVDIIVDKKIIEYFGDYWHGHESFFPDDSVIHPSKKCIIKEIREHDSVKIDKLKKAGYDVEIVWEHEFYSDKVKVFEKINKFLNDT